MSTPPVRVVTTLRVAGSPPARDAAVATWLQSPAAQASSRRAVLVEGVLFDRIGPQGVPLVGLGAGCPCCTGLVSLRVVLGRTLRALRPEAVLLLISRAEHLPRLRRMFDSGELGARLEIED